MDERDMFKAVVMKGNKKVEFEEQRDNIMEWIADIITQRLNNGDREPLILQAGTGVGKSSTFLYHLYRKNPAYRVVCS